MSDSLQGRVRPALERPHRLGMIGGDLDDQLAHCAGFLAVIDAVAPAESGRGADLGSGGGVPGIYLAAARPGWSWRFIEIRTGRAAELERMSLQLRLSATVDTRPAQDVGHDPDHRERYDLVTARSFGPPALAAECGAGLLALGGRLVVSEPPSESADRERWPADELGQLGFGPAEMRGDHAGRFAVLTKVDGAPPAVPRRPPRGERGWFRS